jgi:hypothetical protein
VSRVADAFRMTDEVWCSHANPWSVATRFAAIPPLVLAIWSRAWIGWWCLLPLAAVALWLWLNPRVFAPVREPHRWASKGIHGEMVWARHPAAVPPAHRTALRWIAAPGAVGIGLTAWGLVALDVWPTVTGVALVVLAQLWRIDRLGWMHDDLVRAGGVPRGTAITGDGPSSGRPPSAGTRSARRGA